MSKAEKLLIGMVEQYLFIPLDKKTMLRFKNTFAIDDSLTNQRVAEYLIERGLAKWTDEKHWAFEILEAEK